MSNQHVRGAVSTARGNVKEVAGKLTGDKKLEATERS
ncbi:MAG: CsbD family protein [Candidatus Limnocylindrales bacterium]